MNKKKPLLIITVLSLICTIVWLPFVVLGYIIYLLSKLMRSLGFILMLKKNSARDELAGFWQVYQSLADYKVGLLKN